MDEYAMEGYKVHAFSFWTKPVRYAALLRHLTEAFAALDRERGGVIVVSDGASRWILEPASLLYAEVWQHHTKFVFQQDQQTCKVPLSQIEAQAVRYGFFRCHKSFLVNFRHISRIDFDTITMSNGSQIPLSKYRRKEFLSAWSMFMGARL